MPRLDSVKTRAGQANFGSDGMLRSLSKKRRSEERIGNIGDDDPDITKGQHIDVSV